MRTVLKLLAIVLCSSAVGSAQVAPYAGGGIGANGLSFQSPYYDVDAGVDWGSPRSTLFEAEAGADTANPDGLKDGVTVRAHGFVMLHATEHCAGATLDYALRDLGNRAICAVYIGDFAYPECGIWGAHIRFLCDASLPPSSLWTIEGCK